MATDIELWFSTKVEDLGTDANIKSTLLEMKSVITTCGDGSVLRNIAGHSTNVNRIFDCLNTADAEQLELTTDTIFLLLKNLDGGGLLSAYTNLIHRALGHPSAQVKSTMLRLLGAAFDTAVIVHLSGNSAVLLEDVVQCLACADRSIAQGAVNMLTKMSSSQEGLKLLFAETVLENMKKVMLVDDITRFRVYEVTVAVAVRSPEGLTAGCVSGLLPALLTELKSTDSLIQLNVLELMNSLSSVDHGLVYLQDSGVIPYLVDKILKIEEEPLSFILLPGLIEFFGNIYKMKPRQFNELYPQTLKVLFNSLDTPDPVLLGVIITTVGHIGSSNEGKRVLQSNPAEMTYFFNKARRLVSNQNETAITVMNVLSVLLTVDNNGSGLLPTTESWYSDLGPDILKVVLENANLPFIDLRIAGLHLINAIASQPWGVTAVCNFPGITEYLLDRSTEADKDCKYAKFEIVETIVTTPKAAQLIGTDGYLKLQQFVAEGPFFVLTEPEVAFEGST